MHPIERLKLESRGLRGTLADELAGPAEAFSAEASHLLKFHGMYQQKERSREEAKPHTLLVRGKIPGGRLSAAQWLAWDTLADRFGDRTLRLTTRQGIELHGVLKGDAPETLRALRAALQTTQGACGDVVRNVTQPPNPRGRADLGQLDAVADLFTERFQAKSTGYAEIFLDGEPVADPAAARHEGDRPVASRPLRPPRAPHRVAGQSSATPPVSEPLYGATYLPRKFKIALTLEGNNAVDVYSNDLAFAGTLGADGRIDGWHVFAGGGMGMTHKDPETFPRLADALGWIPADALIAVAEAVITIQRDFGGRVNRKRARLKYLLHDRGLSWFAAEVEARAGVRFQARSLPAWNTPSYLGWQRREDGHWSLGFHTLSGRIVDLPGRPLKTALREVLVRFAPSLQLTPDQDLVLLGLRDQDRSEVEKLLQSRGISSASPHPLYDRALACVALPLCGVAITEGERAAPRILETLRERLDARGLGSRSPVVRLTGCPNGCARPYDAEVGLVGQGVGTYALYLGGHPEGHRLAFLAAEKVPLEALADVLDPLLEAWAAEATSPSFGDFTAALSAEGVRALLAPARAGA